MRLRLPTTALLALSAAALLGLSSRWHRAVEAHPHAATAAGGCADHPVAGDRAVEPAGEAGAALADELAAGRDTVLAAVLPGVSPATDWRTAMPASLTLTVDRRGTYVFGAPEREAAGEEATWLMRSGDGRAAVLVGTTVNGGIDFICSEPGQDEVSVSVRGDAVTVVHRSRLDRGCGATMAAQAATPARPAGTEALAAGDSAAAGHASDLLVAYGPEVLPAAATAAADRDGAAFLLTTARNQVRLANLALENSRITNFRWRLVGVAAAPAQVRTGRMSDDLARLSDEGTELGRWAAGAAADTGADQVVLWVDGPSDWAGLAWVPGHHAVVQWGTSFRTLAHELGHNLGCRHDRQTEGATDGDGHYGYAHRFTANGKDLGDLMSYAANTYDHFSNPALTGDLSLLAAPMYSAGAGPVVLGVAATEPRAADAARTILEAAAAMAAHRPTVVETAPVVATQPADVTVVAGEGATLSVAATGGGLSYQWRRNGVALAGATQARLVLDAATAATGGEYDCVVSNGLGAVTTLRVAVGTREVRRIPAAPAGGRIIDISARANVGTGADVLIGGVVIAGGPAQVLVRAVGPGLATQGVGGWLADPMVSAFDVNGRKFAENRDWHDGTAGATAAELGGTFRAAGAFALPDGSRDACLLLTLGEGAYTFVVAGEDGGTGVGLIEIYLVKDSGLPGYLVDLAARARAGSGGQALFGGVVVEGDAQVMVRGVGPGLAALGVGGVLNRARLNVFDLRGQLLDAVGAWDATYGYAAASELFRKVGAFGLAAGSGDAISVMNLSAADPLRTFQVEGEGGEGGVALVEVYLVRP